MLTAERSSALLSHSLWEANDNEMQFFATLTAQYVQHLIGHTMTGNIHKNTLN